MRTTSAAGILLLTGLRALAQSSELVQSNEDAPPLRVIPVQPSSPVPTGEPPPAVIRVVPVVPTAPAGSPMQPATQDNPPDLRGDAGGKLTVPSRPQLEPVQPLPPVTPPSAAPTPAPSTLPNSPSRALSVSPEQRQLGLADLYYSQQQWDSAVTEYQHFIFDFPNSSQYGAALYRLADAYMKQGNVNSARMYYGKLVALPKPGAEGGVAAFRLAEFERQEKDFAAAEAHYKLAAQYIPDPNVKISAKYFTARCLQELDRKAEARVIYQTLADMSDAHPFREVSQFQAALLGLEAGRVAESLKRFEKLAAEASNPDIKAEAATRAALALTELPDHKAALVALEKAVQLPQTTKWHGILQLGILKMCVALGDNERVISAFHAAESAIDAAQLPDILMLVGSSHRALKQNEEAAVVFSKLLEVAPDSPLASTARYERLVCYYNLDRKDLTKEIDAFLASTPAPQEADNALLMKAETLRVRGDYSGAGAAYAQVTKSKQLKAERRNDALMRWAECAVRSQDAEGTIAASTALLTAAPNYPLASTALFWRAETRRGAKQYAEAERDYDELITRFPTSTDRETSLKQLALLRGEQNDNSGMSAGFERLLKEYPETASKAEAHHWIGRSAFEAKDYKTAVPHLLEARKLDPANYFESDSLRLVYCAYNLNLPDDFWQRVQEYQTQGKSKVSPDLLRWCAQSYLDAKQMAKAEPPLALLCSGEEVTENDWLQLANARFAVKNLAGTMDAVKSYLPLVKHPNLKARGLLVQSKAQLELGSGPEAQKTVDEIVRLQPEGPLNAEARLVSGDIQMAQKNFEAAAKLFESVSIAFDDDQVAPASMEKAYYAYRSGGKLKESMAVLNRLQSRYPEYAREHKLR
jgi:tetratricopeptide (TPR) repeat protein